MIDSSLLHSWLNCGTLISSEKEKLLIGWGKRTWHANPSTSRQKPSFYFPDYFFSSAFSWFTHEYIEEISIHDLIEVLRSNSKNAMKPRQWRNFCEPLFKDTFLELKQKFESGQLKKAVPFVFEFANSSMTDEDLRLSLSKVLNYSLHNHAFLYGFWEANEGMLGATPEILFRFLDETAVETMACAGTRNILEDPSTLLHDPKELHEHELVVQGIVDSLKCFGIVKTGKVDVLKLSRMAHLVTPISIELKVQASFEMLAKALHPTPAVGAFPKENGHMWLREYQEKVDRKRFGAPAGFIMPASKKACCYVAIRNVQWNSQQLLIGAGCGLVSASRLEKEWAEINLKLQATKEMLGL